MRLERLGLFSPIFRVRTPQVDYPLFHIPVRRGNNWFTNNWAWDTTGIPQKYEVPDPKDRSQEGYYSVFQIDYLDLVLAEMTIHVQWDSFLDRSGGYRNIDWKRIGNRWMDFAEAHLESLRSHEYRRSVALLCQYISNRYYPKTQGDQRTLQVGGGIYSDHWIFLNGHDWDWDREIEEWDPREAARLFRLTPEKLRHAYNGLAIAQAHCDPLERWYQLVQFVAVRERARLKGDALRSETLRSGAHMLRLLHQDLYGEELPHPNETTVRITTHIPELAVRQDARRYLEFVANRFHLNP